MILDNDDKTISAMNFLIYSYFNISMEDTSEQIIDAVIKRSYRDAASHVLSFKEEKKDTAGFTEDEREVAKINAKKEASDKIKAYIEQLVTNKIEDYDKNWHENLCDDLVKIYGKYEQYQNKEKRFTCGIAQKWVNMSVKYIYLLCYLFNYMDIGENEFSQKYAGMIEKYMHCFHIPLDSYMYRAIEQELKINKISKVWSKVDDYEEYSTYQKAVRENVPEGKTPIDWENKVWIKEAKKTKKD